MISEVPISNFRMLLLYRLQNTRRTADVGKIQSFSFIQSTGSLILITHFWANPTIFLSADVPFSTPSPASPSEYPCLYPNCGHISSRAHDLKRHMTVHFPPAVDELLDCKYEWCGRTGAHGFKREDHRKEHYRKVHMKENEYPKTGKGGRSGKVSGRSTRD